MYSHQYCGLLPHDRLGSKYYRRFALTPALIPCLFLQLEEKIREKVNGEYKQKISFQDECDLFVRSVNLVIMGRVVLIPSKCCLHCHHRDG